MKKLLLSLLVATGVANASVQTQTNFFDVDHDGVDSFFDQFDSSLGTLTGVQLTITSIAAGSFTIVNSSPSSTTDVSNIINSLYVSSYQPDEFNVGTNLPTINLLTTLTSGLNPVAKRTSGVNGSTTFSINSAPSQYLANNFSFNILTISPYIGSGSVTFMLQDTTSATLIGGTPSPNYNNISDPTTLTLTYSYTAVPEPSTYALFGIGAIGMLMVMRRKKTA